MAQLTEDQIARLRDISVRHGASIGRIQLFAEIGRLGFKYAQVYPELKAFRAIPTHPIDGAIQKYVADQKPYFFDLHDLVCVRMWATLEAFISDSIRFAVSAIPIVRQSDALRKLKGPLLSFLEATEDEQADQLLRMLEDAAGGSLRNGIGRFESVLKSLGLGGPVDDSVREAIFRCAQYRNCIVHHDGVIDGQLAGALSSLKGLVSCLEKKRNRSR